MRISWIIIGFGLSLAACQKDPATQTVFPAHFPQPHYQSESNPLTTEGIALGKQLFYDPFLSQTGEISCGSCHFQAHGFGDHNVAQSRGIFGRPGKRNSPPIVNMAWNTSFMWDGGINHLEVMPLGPLTDTVEMGEKVAHIIAKLQNHSTYPQQFKKAFGSDSITDQKLLFALAQFMVSLVSADAKYDQYLLGEAELTEEETRGLTLFRQHCEHCHQEPLFTDYSFRNNGIDTDFTIKDIGRERITLNPNDKARFKVPTLRNIARTYPYLHDGRMTTLEDVLAHYATGIQASATLDSALPVGGLGLSAQDQSDIIAFLRTLTDYTFLTNPDFSE